MARKPRSQWSEAYRRRILRAEAAGKSRQAARGHKAAEHVERKRRELATGMLTTSQRQSVRKFAREQAKRAGDDPETVAARLLDWSTRNGYDAFTRVRDRQREEARWYRGAVKSGTWASRGTGYLDIVADDMEEPEISWLYYH